MKTNPRICLFPLPALLALAAGPVLAQTVSLAQSPLYLEAGVKPNVLVVYDNSPSMEFMLPGGQGTVLLAHPNTRGNIARAALRDIISTYRSQFRWGLATFENQGLYGPTYDRRSSLPVMYYSRSTAGMGLLRRAVQDDSTAHQSALLSLLATETENINTPEIKNGSIGTPLPGAMRTAYQYYANTLSGTSSPITNRTCQRNYVLLATDGDPTIRIGGTAYSNAELMNRQVNGNWVFGQAAQDVFTEIGRLRTLTVSGNAAINGQYDVQTYVVGLGEVATNQASIAAMNRMATVGGTGSAYMATDRATLSAAFAQITADIQARTAASAGVAISTGAWKSGTQVFQARFNTGDWSGELRALEMLSSGELATTPTWEAGQRLGLKDWSTGRQILTYRAASALGSRGVPFRWPANAAAPGASEIPLTLVAALNRNGAGVVDTHGALRLNYLRGDASRELRRCPACTAPSAFRNRPTTVLGDIVNSTPLLVTSGGRFVRDSAEAAAYDTFRRARAAMAPVVYVGANDGQLHAFDARTGDELFAYVPGLVADRLAALPEAGYTHQYSVDGPLAAGDVHYAGGWKTLLVGTAGAGAKGLYALDISDPANFTEATASRVARWEIDGSDASVGHILQQPLIAKARNGRWMVFSGNGLNSSAGVAQLLAIDAETGAVSRISTLTGTAASPNGLLGLTAISTAGDGVVDIIYAGDQQGRLWKFDLSASDPLGWKVAYGSAAVPQPLFSAASGQAITARPDVTPHPAGGYLVSFGTGSYLSRDDLGTTTTQSLYGIRDSGTTVSANELVGQSVLGTQTGGDGRTYRFSTYAVGRPSTLFNGDNQLTEAAFRTGKKGWRLDLPASGERIVTEVLIRAGKVIVSTLIPSSDPCAYGGDGWVMELDAITGNRADSPALDTNGDNRVDAADRLTLSGQLAHVSGVRVGGIPSAPSIVRASDRALDDKIVNTSSGTTVRIRESGITATSGRASWEQLQ
ncbi:type IV pilus assembly protein PilY1 [Sphaerotilus sulfidivorans]|uniref:Pilus assembly protein PilY n=1 Tax=Sphaerotilus sulfidivorans TaxID=639200 RepID=A0A5C1Q196_9BURK|nr:PilC/PilY family type IV pilus protein [Sphaerotilus sulfidivorans]NZD44542.1 pilus assembly protein PilY [Sphaerotilus sulfidivorans]QEN01281.1 pilus assembly protein PilY [Sphaerotilus sulfidivorans]